MIYEEFLKRARDKHGDTYDYPRWEGNINVHSKVPVICKEHGDFEQTINNHTRGSKGCRTCGVVKRANSKRTTYEHFVVMARKKHGDRYTYPKWSAPKTQKDKVVVWCPDHGEFTQNIDSHIRACGCPSCGRESSGANRRLGTKKFLEKARSVHHNKYAYMLPINYHNGKSKIAILCHNHGVFHQPATNHLGGQGCPVCRNLKIAESKRRKFGYFLKKVKEVHSSVYAYLLPKEFLGAKYKIDILCHKHGVFSQNLSSHLSGVGCPACGADHVVESSRVSVGDFVNRAQTTHDYKYTYPIPLALFSLSSKIKIMCPDHGEFIQVANAHVRGKGCPKCKPGSISAKKQMPIDELIKRLERHPSSRGWQFIGRDGQSVKLFCPQKNKKGSVHGGFTILLGNMLSKNQGCPKCGKKYPKTENEVKRFIQSLGLSCMKAKGNLLPGLGRYEIDILVPELKIGIEYNGLVWHSEKFKTDAKEAHLRKTRLMESLGYRLIHIFEDEWLEKECLVKARLRAILGSGQTKVFGRKTKVVKPAWGEAQEFLNKSHLQGPGTCPSHILGLSVDGELLSVATFSKSRFSNKYDWELVRFATKPDTRIVGGLSKLIKNFARQVSGGLLISYADRRWSQGYAYHKSGFEFSGNTEPNYFYMTDNNSRLSRQRFQKHKLPKVLDKFDSALTEAENCNANGFYRIWDCGSSRWTIDLGSLV